MWEIATKSMFCSTMVGPSGNNTQVMLKLTEIESAIEEGETTVVNMKSGKEYRLRIDYNSFLKEVCKT